jgi:hypothetical protein
MFYPILTLETLPECEYEGHFFPGMSEKQGFNFEYGEPVAERGGKHGEAVRSVRRRWR